MGYGECCVNELMIREQCFLKSCLKWFITKKCIICLSTLGGENSLSLNKNIRIVHTLTDDDCKHEWHWQEVGQTTVLSLISIRYSKGTCTYHSGIWSGGYWGVCSVILLDWQKYQRVEIIFTLCTLMSPWLAAACRRHCKKENLQSWKKRRETFLS